MSINTSENSQAVNQYSTHVQASSRQSYNMPELRDISKIFINVSRTFDLTKYKLDFWKAANFLLLVMDQGKMVTGSFLITFYHLLNCCF